MPVQALVSCACICIAGLFEAPSRLTNEVACRYALVDRPLCSDSRPIGLQDPSIRKVKKVVGLLKLADNLSVQRADVECMDAEAHLLLRGKKWELFGSSN